MLLPFLALVRVIYRGSCGQGESVILEGDPEKRMVNK